MPCSAGSSLPAADYQWTEVSCTLLTVSLWKTCVFQQIGTSNTNREGEPQNHYACFALQPQVCYSPSTGWTRKFVKVLDISWNTQWCSWFSLMHRTLGQGSASPQAWSQLPPKNGPTGHMYNAVILWRKLVFLLCTHFRALELPHAYPCEYPSLWVANKIGQNKINFLKSSVQVVTRLNQVCSYLDSTTKINLLYYAASY